MSGYPFEELQGNIVLPNSPLITLTNPTNIPRSWGYTAEKSYASPAIFGSLTIGGYDAARVDMSSSLVIPFDSDQSRTFTVAIQTIAISGNSITSTPVGMQIYAVIDSVITDLWLPAAVCSSFESALGLVWNDTFGMYLINNTMHNQLAAEDPIISFALAANLTNTTEINVNVPYSAFDLKASYPLAGIVDNTTTQRYFPLKRAANDSQIFLGRVFL
jgi:hypothetical protein